MCMSILSRSLHDAVPAVFAAAASMLQSLLDTHAESAATPVQFGVGAISQAVVHRQLRAVFPALLSRCVCNLYM